MNYLAHILLSKSDIHYQIGNLLADPLKGKPWEGANPLVISGFEMHKTIDKYTDAHPIVSKSMSRLRSKGNLKGVIIDIVYDHLLTKHWNSFVQIDFENFIASFYHHSSIVAENLPDHAGEFIRRIRTYEILNSYTTLPGLERTFNRLDNRLSEKFLKRESASSYIGEVKENLTAIENDFLDFFPELINKFITESSATIEEHHFISI